MKKVSFFTPSLNIGGIERVFMTYANSLIRKFNIEYVVCYEEGDLKQFLNKKVNCVILNSRLPYSLFKLVRYILNNHPDYIITGGDIPNAIVLIANKLAGSKTRIIISQHNYLNIEQINYLSKFIYRFIYKFAYKIIAVSDDVAKFIEKYKIEKEKIVVIYNPIDIKLIYTLSKNQKDILSFSDYILYVGRLSEVKNLNFLIQSFYVLKKFRTNLRLIIVGDGPVKNSLESLTLTLGLKESVFFTGIVPDPYFLIKNSLFVVLPSFSEAFPTIILESFCLGKTVVATPTRGALALIKKGEYGFLSDSFDDIQEFSDLMALALSSNINVEALKNYSKNFDITRKVGMVEDILT